MTGFYTYPEHTPLSAALSCFVDSRTLQAKAMALRSNTPRLSERDFQAQIIQLARMSGWLCYHTHDSRRSEPGWPDLAMTQPGCGNQPGRLILAEIKSDRGKLTAEQSRWLEALGQVSGIEVFCWRPSDWSEIVSVLQTGAGDVGRDCLASVSRHTTAHGETARDRHE